MSDGGVLEYFNWGKTVKVFRTLTVIIVVILALESALAWAFVVKRSIGDQPTVDLIERYAVLRPFRGLFPDQYKFPDALGSNFVGDISIPGVRGRFWVADPMFGHRLAPNAVAIDNVWTWYATNPQGFTITDPDDLLRIYTNKKDPGVFRILMLGSSGVEGMGASGSLMALPAQVLNVLSGSYLPVAGEMDRFEVINAGVAAYPSALELLYYLSELHLLNPDLVISYGGGSDMRKNNDLAQQFGPDFQRFSTPLSAQNKRILTEYYDWSDVATLFAKRSLSGLVDLLRRSATIDIAIRAARKAIALVGGGASTLMGGTTEAAPTQVYFTPDSVDLYGKNMRRFAREVNADGAAFAWILQPLFGASAKPPAEGREREYAKNLGSLIERRQDFYKLAREQLAQFVAEGTPENTCTADLSKIFDNNPDPVYQDFSHLYDAGNHIVAQQIAVTLQACGLIRLDSGPN